jgi:hypothetical protein
VSKPLAVKVMLSDSVTIRTTDNGSSVVLDQNAVQNTIIAATNATSKGILVKNDPNVAIQLLGGDMFIFDPGGNIISTGSEIIENASVVQQSMLTSTVSRTLNPANATYNELNNTDVPGLNITSRLNVAPAALGTTINSIVVSPPNPNPDGREIWIQNIGANPAEILTLTNLSGAGTVGGLFRAPGDYIIPAGGGASIMFDSGQNEWLVRGI